MQWPMQWIAFCGLSAAFATLAGVFMRKAALAGTLIPQTWQPPYLTRPMILLAVAVLAYGISFVGYFLAVRHVSLRIAYPVMVGFTCMGMYLASLLYFHEPKRLADIAGIALVIAGITVLARST